MKIQKVEFENINSLKGYWCIDFTHPDYAKNHDLFVICGETGAGKTTILDAITLALYGETPRQGKLTSTNEVMTRHTNHCFARVTFECKKGRFSSEFTQKRKADGNVAPAVCLVKNEITGEIFSNLRVGPLADKITETIQLNYEQFCRSIMLAQGDFDKFIMSDERERSAILAKLTGTEKYRKIGEAVGKKATEINRKFELLQSQKSGMQFLSDGEVENLKKNRSALELSAAGIQKQVDEVDELLKWLQDLAELSGKFETAKENLENCKKNEDKFKEKDKLLERAEKARNCDADYEKFNLIFNSVEKNKNDLSAAKTDLKKKQDELKFAEENFSKTKNAFDAEDKKSEVNEKLWKKVRDLDSKISPVMESEESEKNRLDAVEAEYNQAKETKEKVQENISDLNAEIGNISSYLSENSQDKELSSIIAVLQQKNEAVKKNILQIQDAEASKNSANAQLEEQKVELDAANSKKSELNSKLKELVSLEFVSVSKLIRNQIQEGKPCPVCGSKEHPSCNSQSEKTEFETKTLKVAGDVSELSSQLEKAEKNISAISEKISVLENDVKNSETILQTESAEKASALKEINETISKWGLKIQDEEKLSDFSSILEKLSERGEIYSKKEAELSENQNNLAALQATVEGINLDSIQKNLDEARGSHSAVLANLNSLKNQRTELFGEKNVDEEEKLFKDNLEKLENSADSALETKNSVDSAKKLVEAKISDIENQISENTPLLNDAEKNLKASLSKNGFENKEEYLACVLSQPEIDSLKEEKVKLTKKITEANNSFETAKNDYEKCSNLKKTSLTMEELAAKKSEIQAKQTETNQEIGSINTLLQTNEKNVEQGQKLLKEFEECQEQKLLWDEMNRIVGKKDGADMEVFVQALAFDRLIKMANCYVEAISGKYSLVQVPGKVDFLIHDKNYPNPKDDRPISNMSGGEKFIISLSFALGIAELAGQNQNVRVDSLFMDEGFGTLSGDPLFEAIIALKQLQKTGKMLGIITHVDTVINEFDQKITAVKKAGGVSELIGSGITRKVLD